MIGETTVARADRMGTILLLCSDAVMLSVLREALEAAGYVTLPAANLSSAIDHVERAKPDLLIVRPHIASMLGHEAALYLRNKQHGLRILMVGGLPDDDRIRNREQLRGVEVFPKPFTAAELIEKVRQVLAQPAREGMLH
jgi:DNA-binding response OmpR family regulator